MGTLFGRTHGKLDTIFNFNFVFVYFRTHDKVFYINSFLPSFLPTSLPPSDFLPSTGTLLSRVRSPLYVSLYPRLTPETLICTFCGFLCKDEVERDTDPIKWGPTISIQNQSRHNLFGRATMFDRNEVFELESKVYPGASNELLVQCFNGLL